MIANIRLKWLGIIVAALILLLSQFVAVDGLSAPAIQTCAVMLATLVLLIFESFNVCVTCLMAVVLLYALGGVPRIGDAFSGYANHTLYFVIASFGLSLAMQKCEFSKLLLETMLRLSKKQVKSVILTFMLCTGILSAFMSNVAALILFIPYANKFLEICEDEASRVRLKRSMTICIALSAMIGGLMTPAGSSINLISLDLMEKHAGIHVRFIDWCAVGIPISLVMIVVAFCIVTMIYRPDNIPADRISAFQKTVKEGIRITKKDWYILFVLLLTITLWILSSWFPVINVTVVSILCLALMFVPGFSVMTWDEYNKAISWPAFFIAGTMISIASAVTENGLSAFVVQSLMPAEFSAPMILVVAFIAAMTIVFMWFVPVAPAAVSVLIPVVILFAQQIGISAIIPALTCSFCVCNGYLFPLDTPMVVAYDQKAFTMFELPKVTIWIQIALVAVISIWMPVICSIVF